MAVYQIVKLGDPILRQKCKPVPKINDSILKLLDNLRDSMYDAEGVGLAAPQIGVPKRVIVVDVGDGLVELINPRLLTSKGSQVDQEGCLSIPGTQGLVPRPVEAQIAGLDRLGREVEIKAAGLLARALLHEMDHLDGVLFIDKMLPEAPPARAAETGGDR